MLTIFLLLIPLSLNINTDHWDQKLKWSLIEKILFSSTLFGLLSVSTNDISQHLINDLLLDNDPVSRLTLFSHFAFLFHSMLVICIVDRCHQFPQKLHWRHLHRTDRFIFPPSLHNFVFALSTILYLHFLQFYIQWDVETQYPECNSNGYLHIYLDSPQQDAIYIL